MKKTLSNYYLLVTLIFASCVVIAVAVLYGTLQKEIFLQNNQSIHDKVLENYKHELQNRVEIIEQTIAHKYNQTQDRLKNSIQKRVYEAHDIIESLYQHNKESMDEKALKHLIIEALRTIRFNEGRGYYFIDTLEGECVLFPIRPSDEGKNILHYKDVNNKLVIQDFVDIARQKKEGFSVYHTYKPGKDKERFAKIAFVKLFERWGWVVGAGEYLDDVEEDIKREIAKEISTYRTDNNENYINIFEVHHFEGGDDFASVIVSPNQEGSIYGQKISTNIKDIDGVSWREEALEKLNKNGDGFVTYKFKKITTNEVSSKISYFKKIHHWNWVVSTGKQLDGLEKSVQEAHKTAEITLQHYLRVGAYILAGVLAVLMMVSWFISRRIKHDTGKMIHFLRRGTSQKIEIEESLFYIEEFRELSVYINTMTQELKEHHARLSLMNENLEFKVYEKTKELQNLNLSLELKNKELEHNYFTDTLTKLPNRNSLMKALISTSFPQAILLDIDGFKNINDFYGTQTGDSVLVEFAEFIKVFIEPYKMYVYRLSSDEFVILYDHRFDKEFIQAFLQNMSIILVTRYFNTQGEDNSFQIGITCGVAFGKGNILEKADIALNFAKKKKLSYAIYQEDNPLMNTHQHNLHWRHTIQYALEHDAIIPYFQKIVDTKESEVQKYECLMRLFCEDGTIVSPYLFLDVAKETKLYHEISRQMMRKSIEAFSHNAYSFSLNISLLDIENKTTVEHLKELIVQYDCGSRLILELLESEEIMNSDKFLLFVTEMKSLGVRFALDDFGSGYSNFAFVLKIAPSFLKIDGSLIEKINDDKGAYNIIQAIVAFAKEINAHVVAECVENEAMVESLEQCGIYTMQGYHFSIPSATL